MGQDPTCSRAKLPIGCGSALVRSSDLIMSFRLRRKPKWMFSLFQMGSFFLFTFFCSTSAFFPLAFYSYWTKAITAAITLEQFHLDSHSSLQAVSLCHSSSANGLQRTLEPPPLLLKRQFAQTRDNSKGW